jgi:hypothetical protein
MFGDAERQFSCSLPDINLTQHDDGVSLGYSM